MHAAGDVEAAHPQHRTLAHGAGACWVELELLELAPDHQVDQPRRGRTRRSVRRRRRGRRAATVTRSTSVEDLVHAVRDEDDRDAVVAQRADDVEQRRDLVVGQRARRLVEDHHARDDREGARDLDHLLLVGPQLPDRLARIDVELEPREDLGARRRACAASRCPTRRRALRGPRKMFSATDSSRTSVVSCVTVAMPGRHRARGVGESHLDGRRARRGRCRLELPGEDLQQRRLAGAVLADQPVDLARAQLESRRRAARARRRSSCARRARAASRRRSSASRDRSAGLDRSGRGEQPGPRGTAPRRPGRRSAGRPADPAGTLAAGSPPSASRWT